MEIFNIGNGVARVFNKEKMYFVYLVSGWIQHKLMNNEIYGLKEDAII